MVCSKDALLVSQSDESGMELDMMLVSKKADLLVCALDHELVDELVWESSWVWGFWLAYLCKEAG